LRYSRISKVNIRMHSAKNGALSNKEWSSSKGQEGINIAMQE
jgi:hypothetical protein